MSEIALILFTFCLQAAIGIMLFYVVGKELVRDKEFKAAALASAILGIVAILASLFHLGRPLAFLNSLANLGSSWLSIEALFAGIFTVIAVVYVLLLYLKPSSHIVLRIAGWAGSLVGILTVAAMAKVYTSTIIPLWQGLNTYVEFYATTIAVGGLLFLVLGKKELRKEINGLVGLIILGAVFIQAGVAIPYALSLSQGGMAAQTSAEILSAMGTVLALKWLLVLIGAGILMWPYASELLRTNKNIGTGVVYIACVSVVVGQFIGRYIFYAALVAPQIGLT
ncbi:MAG: dimethyl sulfoxide reductase anchor subunit [Peptococcaceae bacterium]|nr:dimethyl sulfoxide reductase anchor subunit [Peptococcaceae bacterium]